MNGSCPDGKPAGVLLAPSGTFGKACSFTGTACVLLVDGWPAAAAVGVPPAAPTAPAPPVGVEAVPVVPPEVADGVAVTGPD